MAGDLRVLYLMWLACVDAGDVDDGVVEPPVPPGLGNLTGSLTALTDFLRIDRDLLAVAAEASAPAAQRNVDAEIVAVVEGLAAAERDALLLALLRGDDPHLRAETLRRVRSSEDLRSAERTAGELIDAARARGLERERAEQHRGALAAVERERRAAAAREQRVGNARGRGRGCMAAGQRADRRTEARRVRQRRRAAPGPTRDRR
jgi:hypothetical protein